VIVFKPLVGETTSMGLEASASRPVMGRLAGLASLPA